MLRHLSQRKCLVLQGPGGVGKTRLLLEAADFDSGSRAWRFVDESVQVPPDALGELGGGDELVVVIDNAHRRRDLRAILGVLERRDPMPKVVFVVRPYRLDEIRSATAGLWLDVSDERDFLSLRPLARSLIADMVRGEPFEIGYAGMVSHVAAIAEGNPLIAVLAATLARNGRSLPEITRDEVFAGHVAGLLSTLTHDDPNARQLRQLMAIASALDGIDANDERMVAAITDLLGFGLPAMRRWLTELADRGLLVSTDESRFVIKPDLLADHVLLSSFFTRRWRPVLAYESVVAAFAGSHLMALCRALGRVPYGELDVHRPGLQALAARVRQIVRDGDLTRSAQLVLELLPGAEDLALPALRTLIHRVTASPDLLTATAAEHLINATQRVNADIAASWRLLLELASAAAGTPTFDAASQAMREIYKRVPVDESDQDGHVLADVQRTLADVTAGFTRQALTEHAFRAAAAAGRALAIVVFDDMTWSLDDPRTVEMHGYAVPGSEPTRAVLHSGVQTLAATLLRIPPADQLQSLEAATALARHAAGYRGPGGARMDDRARSIATEELGHLDAFLAEHFEELSLPVRAAALSYLRWNRAWNPRDPQDGASTASAPLPPLSSELDEYVLLIHPREVGPPDEHHSWEDEHRDRHARCEQLARELVGDSEWRERFRGWESWHDQAQALFDPAGDGYWIGVTLAQAARLHPRRAVELIDELISTVSTLRARGGLAVHRLGTDGHLEQASLERWCADEESRAMIAEGIADLDGDLAQATLLRLAEDPSETVRRGVLTGLNHGSDSTDWRIGLGLRVAGELADVQALHRMLLIAKVGGVPLAGMLPAAARQALLATAVAERVPASDLVRVLNDLEPVTGDLTLAWVWERVDWLGSMSASPRATALLPDQLASRVHRQATHDDLLRALSAFESAPRSSPVSVALIDLIEWIDPNSAAVTDAIVRIHDNADERRAHRLLRLRGLSWEGCESRAVALAERLPSIDTADELVHAMLPIAWSGSRVPQLQSALQHIERWQRRSDDPRFRRAVEEAAEEIRRWIAGDRDRERRQDELAGLR